MRQRLPTTVLALGVVSLLTDLSSEMIYPLLPLFLTTVLAAGPAALGVIEGVAEATAALLKLLSGVWSDRARRRTPLVLAGYSLAGLARPLIAVAGSWPAVLGLRFADRVGKGLRSSPRDALVADVTPPELRGRAFGVQRAMDHAGAVAGPLVAAALLGFAGWELRHVFLLAAVPAVLAVAVLLAWVREAPRPAPAVRKPLRASLAGMDRRVRRVVLAVGIFTLGNSTDAFLLLRLGDAGFSATAVAAAWSAFHVVKMGCAWLGGTLSDRWERRGLLLAGWGWYAAVYVGFAVASSPRVLLILFLAYGVYYGLTEPVEKAWIADLVPAARRGTAFGVLNAVAGLAALPASVLFGLVWSSLGAPAAFAGGAALAAAAAAVLWTVPVRGDRLPEETPGEAT